MSFLRYVLAEAHPLALRYTPRGNRVDLLGPDPRSWTALSWKIPIQPWPGGIMFDQEVAVQRAADCVCVAASLARNVHRGGLPEGRDQRGIVLCLAQELWRFDAAEIKWLKQLRGEPAAEEADRRSLAREGDPAGRNPAKNMRPARKRQIVDEVGL